MERSEGERSEEERSAEGRLAKIKAVLSGGRPLDAYDLAMKAVAAFPDVLAFRHQAVLALVRAEMRDLAERQYDEWNLAKAKPDDPKLGVDIAALKARFLKDRALATEGPERIEALRRAAAAYGAIFDATGDSYVGVNAASLSLWAGDRDAAHELAERTLAAIAGDDYYADATRAEALLVLGRVPEATAELERAAAARANLQEWHGTRRQLRITCAMLGFDADAVLAPLAPPSVVSFVGHIPGRRFDLAHEAAVALAIRAELDRLDACFGYGALAAGADILFAEALLARGAELHVVLPFEKGDFVDVSVGPTGADWVARFEACLARATTCRFATEDPYLGDQSLFSYAARYTMGLALRHAAFLGATPRQIAVWDQKPPEAPGGTANEIAFWRELGHEQVVISPEGAVVPPHALPRYPELEAEATGREIRGVLFADVRGFSGLSDAQIAAFVEEALGRLANALERFGNRVVTKNTWGDNIFLILSDALTTAEAAMAVESAWSDVDFAAYGLPSDLSIRVGATVGPVRRFDDPVTGRTNYFGAFVNLGARIEPKVPPGMSYASEELAAALILDKEQRFACDYMGLVELPKGFGTKPLYRLSRRGAA